MTISDWRASTAFTPPRGTEKAQTGDSIKSKAQMVEVEQRLVKVSEGKEGKGKRLLCSILCGVSSALHHPIVYPSVRRTPWLCSLFTHQSAKYDAHTCADITQIRRLSCSRVELADLISLCVVSAQLGPTRVNLEDEEETKLWHQSPHWQKALAVNTPCKRG